MVKVHPYTTVHEKYLKKLVLQTAVSNTQILIVPDIDPRDILFTEVARPAHYKFKFIQFFFHI